MADEMRRQIITTEASERLLNSVSPIYEDSFVGLWLYEVMGREFQSVWEFMDTIPEQFYPESATWALPLWEHRYGLETVEGLDIETRRQRVIEKRDRKRWFGNYRLEEWLSMKSGGIAHVVDNVSAYTFGIVVDSWYGLAAIDSREVQAYIDARKPSHLSYTMTFSSDRRCRMYIGVLLHTGSKNALPVSKEGADEITDYLVDELGGMLVDEGRLILLDE